MKVVELISEMPQTIPDLNHSDVKMDLEFCLQNINHATLLEQKAEYVGLYHLQKNGLEYYFIFNENNSLNEKVEYFVKVSNVQLDKSVIPSYPVKQSLVYKNKQSVFTAGVAKKIFWNYLFTKNNCIVSDSQQTDDGKAFWSYIVNDAFEKGLKVRIINSNDNTYTDLGSINDLASLDSKIWGKAKWFQRMVIAIYK